MKNSQKLVLVFIIAISALLASFVFHQGHVAYLIVTIAGGVLALSMFVEMIQTLRSGSYGVDLLAITAIIATLWVGEYWAALIVVLMLVGGETLEDYAAGRANRELAALLKKSPDIAHVKEGEKIVDKDLKEVTVGSVLLVKPMEVVPIDGVLLSKVATLDESSITGENKPKELNEGGPVVSGSVNGNSTIEIETTVDSENSQFQKIINLVKEAKDTPANFVRLADRYAIPFTIIAYVIAAIAYFSSGDPKRIAEILVVASPCPLILAAPIAFVSGMSRASKNGFLIKNGSVIEKLATAQSIFFDKTGTLTEGKMEVDGIHPVENVSETDLLDMVYSIEKESTHPLAKAVTAYAETQSVHILPVSDVTEVAGMGVSGNIDGQKINIGRATFAHAPENLGFETAFYVSRNEQYIGAVTFSDTLRHNAGQVVSALRQQGLQNITMLTGDNTLVADKIAYEVGIEQVYSQMMPDQKLNQIKEETARPTVMVGDGVNDAPALALA
ncbi:MAG: cadmium-translocating P-type ATPase, partial [Streptococcaceae bacterium]|nr:cadmium-translocating P-type ATPase [Streptococcaceae bacterium]